MAHRKQITLSAAGLESEGPSLEVLQLRNALRRLPYDELAAHPRFTTAVRPFRGEPVCIAVAKTALPDGALAFLVRGFIPGGQAVQEASFLKLADGSWREVPMYVVEELREAIRRESPRGITA